MSYTYQSREEKLTNLESLVRFLFLCMAWATKKGHFSLLKCFAFLRSKGLNKIDRFAILVRLVTLSVHSQIDFR